MPEEITRQFVIDGEHLKLLSIGYMISAGFSALFSLFGLFYVFMGAMVGSIISHTADLASKPDQLPPVFFGWLFAGIGVVFMVVSITFAILKFHTASCIKQRKSRIFCMVIAGISCIEFPYGTALGVATFIVLGRDSVMRVFDTAVPPQPAA